MKQLKKRILTALLVVSAAALVGCGKNSAPEPTGTIETGHTAATTKTGVEDELGDDILNGAEDVGDGIIDGAEDLGNDLMEPGNGAGTGGGTAGNGAGTTGTGMAGD